MEELGRQVQDEAAAFGSVAVGGFDGKFAATSKDGDVHLTPRGKGGS